jgi:hypothetical protein
MSKKRKVILVASILGIIANFLPVASERPEVVNSIGAIQVLGVSWILTLFVFVIPLIVIFTGDKTMLIGKAQKACVAAGVLNLFIVIYCFGILLANDVGIEIGSFLLLLTSICICITPLIHEKSERKIAFLTKCALCNHDVSSESKSCPSCGGKIK